MLFELLKGESRMKDKLLRVGTIYIPVTNVELSSKWYVVDLK
ncbi:hypothetical protein bmyco0002_42910 [Bacillus pseudomycoides]|nr:hypothetical protein bmyco0002_42910 [Bacillus pseudomycoides]